MELRSSLDRVQRGGAGFAGVDAGDLETAGARPRPLDEAATHCLNSPEIRAVGQPADTVLGLTIRGVLFNDRREVAGRAHLPVVGGDPARITDCRPRDRERYGDLSAIRRRQWRWCCWTCCSRRATAAKQRQY